MSLGLKATNRVRKSETSEVDIVCLGVFIGFVDNKKLSHAWSLFFA